MRRRSSKNSCGIHSFICVKVSERERERETRDERERDERERESGVCGGRPPQKKKKRKRKKRILKARAREYYFLGETTHTRERNTTMSTKFLGGMRGLTKFVEKIRNCANQVRARQSNSCIRARIRFLLGPDGRESAKISRNEEREREREREPSEIFAQIS
jgi:hypothetical protein